MTTQANKVGVSLSVLLRGLVDDEVLGSAGDVIAYGLVVDNRKVDEGDVFIAYQGTSSHGLKYAEDAVSKGAVAVIWDDAFDGAEQLVAKLSGAVPCVNCHDLRVNSGIIASRFYSEPSKTMNVIGITGTDGKTSIAHFIAQCLDTHEVHCGVMGTLGNGFIHDLHPTGLTTADALQVQKSLAEIASAGARHVVMEVSSHGLDQGRINGVAMDIAVLSNFTQDHLDYHGTLENYAAAKKKLFQIPSLRAAVINLDDEFGRALARECRERYCVWGYATSAPSKDCESCMDYLVVAERIEAMASGYRIDVRTPEGRGHLKVHLLGRFNVSNVLASLATLLVSHMSLDDALRELSRVQPVAGRMELIVWPGKPVVVVDYAHTAKGLTAACEAIREHYTGRFTCVFGCGGDRDRSKRPEMAEVAERYADHVIVTSDNPRTEEPRAIIDEILTGFGEPSLVEVIEDRRAAIEAAVRGAGAGEVILLAGKGHEASQVIGDVHIAFDDRRVAREILELSA